MYNVNVVEIDNKEYYLIKQLFEADNCYCYFFNVENKHDMCIRKLIVKDGENYLVGLDDEEEFNFAMNLFIMKRD